MEPAVEPGSGGPQASRQARDGPKSRGRRGWRKGKVKASAFSHNMDLRTMTQSLVTLAEDNMAFFSSQGPGETARRLSNVFAGVREQAVGLEPTLGHLLGVAHKFDLDTETPANGYRSLVHTARCCLAHLLHKSRYVASNRRSIFFRASHNLAELEAYLAALTQLRALAYYAQRLLAINRPGGLFFEGDEGLTADFLQDYVTLHKGCFYGRCLGFQTLSIGLVSFGEHIKDLGFKGSSETSDTPEMSLSMETLGPATPSDVNFFLRPENSTEDSSEATDDLSPMGRGPHARTAFPEGFHPRRSSQGVLHMPLYSAPIVKNPFMSPLLAPDSMLKTLPPVHIVACALDPMLDDSVMFARRLRDLGQPVTLNVVEDLPHGFLSLAALCRETRQAAELCVQRIRMVVSPPAAPLV